MWGRPRASLKEILVKPGRYLSLWDQAPGNDGRTGAAGRGRTALWAGESAGLEGTGGRGRKGQVTARSQQPVRSLPRGPGEAPQGHQERSEVRPD